MKNVFVALLVVLSLSLQANNDKNEKGNKASSESSTVFSGVVVDHTNQESLTGVQISIPELGIDTYTDFNGEFQIQLPANGNYTVEASIISYEDKKVKVTQGHEPLKLELDLL
ncbi:MAG: carboxypeptidase-like regulatory domain-containing protein [Salinivirgaceae bacterium]